VLFYTVLVYQYLSISALVSVVFYLAFWIKAQAC
jgi:hypothetical protein